LPGGSAGRLWEGQQEEHRQGAQAGSSAQQQWLAGGRNKRAGVNTQAGGERWLCGFWSRTLHVTLCFVLWGKTSVGSAAKQSQCSLYLGSGRVSQFGWDDKEVSVSTYLCVQPLLKATAPHFDGRGSRSLPATTHLSHDLSQQMRQREQASSGIAANLR